MIVDAVQRWALGREHRRPAGEIIQPRTAGYEVVAVDRPAAARGFVETHHYSGTASPPTHAFELRRRGTIVGAALFGPLPSMNAHRAVFGELSVREGVTLSRLVLDDTVEGNGESWMVQQCLNVLSARGVLAAESCADPVARVDLTGRRVFPGHGGTIYQALNGRYVGRTNAATKYLLPDGREFSNRAQGKISRAEQGRAYAGAILVEFGARPLEPGEDPLEWVRHWRPRICRSFRHRGCHRYLWLLPPTPSRHDERRRFGSHVWARKELRLSRLVDHWRAMPTLPYPKIDLDRAERAEVAGWPSHMQAAA